MAQLVVLICLLATPEQCSEKPVPGATAESVVTCLKTAGDKADASGRRPTASTSSSAGAAKRRRAETKMAGTSPAMTQFW